MVQWVVEAAKKSGVAERVVVATPDDEIMQACHSFGAEAIMTSLDHPSGTDRIAEVSESIDAEVYVNVQGDEPLIDPHDITVCAETLLADPTAQMASLYGVCDPSDLANPAVVKVVTDLGGFALYFSRFAVPYIRNAGHIEVKRHFGVYAYRKGAVQQFASWKPTPLELTEGLEQLRFLEHGVRIKMAKGKGSELAVDTPGQADEVRAVLAARSG